MGMLVAGGPGLPGGHAVWEPGRDDRGPHHAAAGHRRGVRPPRPRRGRRTGGGDARRSTEAGVPHVVQAAGTMFIVFFTGDDGPLSRLRPGLAPGSRGATGPSSTRCSTRVSTCPPSAFEVWFLSSAHDDRALDRVVSALPAASARRPPTEEPHDHRQCSPDAARRGAQPHRRAVRPAAGLPPLRPGQADGPADRRLDRRPRHHPPAWPRRSSAPSRPPSRSRTGSASRSSPTTGSSSPTNKFEGKTFGVGDGALRKPSSWVLLWNPFRPPGVSRTRRSWPA